MAILSCVAMDDHSSVQWKISSLSEEQASAREETVLAELAQVFIDALLASDGIGSGQDVRHGGGDFRARATAVEQRDRKSTRLNSSHGYISYAVFCLKKKNNTTNLLTRLNALAT